MPMKRRRFWLLDYIKIKGRILIMSMVVRTNIMAMNSNRILGVNNSNVAKSIEKLSSGFRINRAADDAAGLAISEKMKAQIVGLEQASMNSQDGISLVQTAEGATSEIHSMLNRMVELAVKSANGTISDELDREAITAECDALKAEIDRIVASTNFNGINLIDGNLAAVQNAVVEAGDWSASPPSQNALYAFVDADSTDVAAANDEVTFTIGGKSYTGVAAAGDTIADVLNATVPEITFTMDELGGITITSTDASIDLSDFEITSADFGNVSSAEDNVSLVFADFYESGDLTDGDEITINGLTYTYKDTADTTLGEFNTWEELNQLLADDGIVAVNASEISDPDDLGGQSLKLAFMNLGGGLTLQVGDTNDNWNKVTVGIDDLSASSLGLDYVDLGSEDTAGDSIDFIKDAINIVSMNRSALGALQNRLDYTINNLDTTAENMTAANSRIRDTDMASEMMEYTKNNVLVQAAQSMLAQANQQPQGILQLLQ